MTENSLNQSITNQASVHKKETIEVKPEFYNFDEVKTILNIEASILKRLTKKDVIKGAYKLGTVWIYRKDVFDKQFGRENFMDSNNTDSQIKEEK